MHSVIYQRDRVANQSHEFGEADGYRYPAVFVRNDGTEEVLLLSPAQVDAARLRAVREPKDVDLFLSRAERRRRAHTVQRLLAAFAVALFVGSIALILHWGSP